MPLAPPVITAVLPEASAGRAVWISVSLIMIFSLFGVTPNLASDAAQASLCLRLRVDHTLQALRMLPTRRETCRLTDWIEILKEQTATGDQMSREVPQMLANPDISVAQVKTLFSALEKQAEFVEKLRMALEGISAMIFQ